MLLKGIFCLCIQTVIFKSVFTQCIPPYPIEPECPNQTPFVEGFNLAGPAPITPIGGRIVGGNLIVDTSAPSAFIGPAGVTIYSDDLIIEGAVLVSGNLPFVGTVGLEGVVPASGSSVVNCECGNGDIAIIGVPGPVTETRRL